MPVCVCVKGTGVRMSNIRVIVYMVRSESKAKQ